MAEYRVNLLNEAFRTAFGITVRRFSLPKPEKHGDISEYKGIELLEADETNYYSVLGTPLLDRLFVKAGTTPKGISYNSFFFGIDPLIEISRAKKIVQTAISGRDSDVIEIIGKENWQVRIRGLLVGDRGKYPAAEVAELANICDLDTSLEIVSDLTNLFNITNLVISNYDFPSIQGFPDTQPYEITALSDSAIELEIGDI